MNATYTTENDSYYGALLHLKRATGESRFPLYDEIGSARALVDASGVVTDTYDMDTFGKPVSTTGNTPNPYRFGAAWGYMTDPSGFLQLGARYYWPEVGRFVSQDPIHDGANWYAYAAGNPVVRTDPTGGKWYNPSTWGGPRVWWNPFTWGNPKPGGGGGGSCPGGNPIAQLGKYSGEQAAGRLGELCGDEGKTKAFLKNLNYARTAANLPAATREAAQECYQQLSVADQNNREDMVSACTDCCVAIMRAAGGGGTNTGCSAEGCSKGCQRAF